MRDEEHTELHPPEPGDGLALNQLVADSPPLDTNSVYCNLLQCAHFHGTSICAKRAGEMVGFISGYVIPERPDTLFIWQVVVARPVRGQGLAGRMLLELLQRPACRRVDFLETTITPTNEASRALFQKTADRLNAEVSISRGFDAQKHFGGKHESEELWRIGPIPETK